MKVKARLLWLDCGLGLDHLHLCSTVRLGVNIFHPASLKFVRGWEGLDYRKLRREASPSTPSSSLTEITQHINNPQRCDSATCSRAVLPRGAKPRNRARSWTTPAWNKPQRPQSRHRGQDRNNSEGSGKQQQTDWVSVSWYTHGNIAAQWRKAGREHANTHTNPTKTLTHCRSVRTHLYNILQWFCWQYKIKQHWILQPF